VYLLGAGLLCAGGQQESLEEHAMQTTHQDMQATHPGRSLRHDLRQAPGFSTLALLLAVLGSVVGTVITGAFGSGQWGALAGAAVGPVISTTFSTRRTGEKGRVRSATVILLSAGALLITVTGFTLADQVAGKSVLPGAHQRPDTFLPLGNKSGTPSPTPSGSGPAIQVQPAGALDCGSADVGTQVTCQVTIKSTGVVALDITRVEVSGTNSDDFTVGDVSSCKSLDPEQSCTMTVQFQPSAPGERDASLVIHQNLPPPDHGTPLQLVGTGTGQPSGRHTLTVTVDASAAAGGVTSSPSGITDCRDMCTGTFDDGTDITLTAASDQGSGQATWEGCDATSGDTCTIHLTVDRTITARLFPIIS